MWRCVVAPVKISCVGCVDAVTGIVLTGRPADDAAVVGESTQIERVDRALVLEDVEDFIDAFVVEAVRAYLDAAAVPGGIERWIGAEGGQGREACGVL